MSDFKKKVLDEVVMVLKKELASLEKALGDSSAAATDPGSKAEGKYDTRSLEMSYLAAGQARQAEALVGQIEILQRFQVVDFEMSDAVALGALLELDQEGEWNWYFLLPTGGGIELEVEDCQITTLTPESPLYEQLDGKRIGESIGKAGMVSELR